MYGTGIAWLPKIDANNSPLMFKNILATNTRFRIPTQAVCPIKVKKFASLPPFPRRTRRTALDSRDRSVGGVISLRCFGGERAEP